MNNNSFYYELLETFCQANDDAMKSKVYDEMVEYADSYACDDIEMYVALYKTAKTSRQRKHVLRHIYNIIDEDVFVYYDEFIQKFREFISLKDFLDEKDEDKFDAICMKVLNFFRNQFQSSVWGLGLDEFIPDAPIVASSEELKEVAELIMSTDMRNLESYQMALVVLGA